MAGQSWSELDAIIVSSSSVHGFPGLSQQIVAAARGQHPELGAPFVLDVGSNACTGFMYALAIGSSVMQALGYRRVACVALEFSSGALPTIQCRSAPARSLAMRRRDCCWGATCADPRRCEPCGRVRRGTTSSRRPSGKVARLELGSLRPIRHRVGERLLALLTARMPEVPELPPGYEVGDCEDGTWAIRVDGSYHDGLDEDEIPPTREEAIEVAWNDWWQGASEEWRGFMTELGAFADEDEE